MAFVSIAVTAGNEGLHDRLGDFLFDHGYSAAAELLGGVARRGDSVEAGDVLAEGAPRVRVPAEPDARYHRSFERFIREHGREAAAPALSGQPAGVGSDAPAGPSAHRESSAAEAADELFGKVPPRNRDKGRASDPASAAADEMFGINRRR